MAPQKTMKWLQVVGIVASLVAFYFFLITLFWWNNPQIRWNWGDLNLEEIDFSGDFTWGVAAAAHQVEGGNVNNQWYLWESAKDPEGNPRIRNGQKAGMACDHWNRYPEDIRLMQELGVSAYRFSIEWSRIEPAEGQFDTLAIRHYQQVCDSLIAGGISPMVTLHHFSNPIWFEQKGAFEKSENVEDFVEFVKFVFPYFKDRVKQWCTINEPNVYVVEGYFNGINPPGRSDPVLAAQVLRNILEAHVRAYHAIKNLPGGDTVEVGLVKNMTLIDPYNPLNLGDWVLSSLVNRVFNESTLNFIETGKFRFVMPTMVKLRDENPDAKGSVDFIGLNYYSHYTFQFHWDLDKAFENKPLPHEAPTDMEYSQYPEGFYRAAKRVGELGVPVIVTENGIADAQDQYRKEFIQRYLYALSRAKSEGVDIRGYYYWSLMDNFEWSSGYDMKFGLYLTNLETQERTLREGSRALVEIIQRSGGGK